MLGRYAQKKDAGRIPRAPRCMIGPSSLSSEKGRVIIYLGLWLSGSKPAEGIIRASFSNSSHSPYGQLAGGTLGSGIAQG
jgi:hypothetical protein